jgi:hypothetical protein
VGLVYLLVIIRYRGAKKKKDATFWLILVVILNSPGFGFWYRASCFICLFDMMEGPFLLLDLLAT